MAVMPTLLLIAVLSAGSEKRVTLEFQKADVSNVLRIFAELMRVNLVLADSVQGQVTISLRSVKVSDAFAAVLQAQGLGFEKTAGSIYRVAPLKVLADEAQARAKLADAKLNEGKLETRLIRVNYARAEELVPHVKALLSPRGSVSVDARTNTLIIRDVAGD
jgi:type II secretory pathway component HofQ